MGFNSGFKGLKGDLECGLYCPSETLLRFLYITPKCVAKTPAGKRTK